MAKLVDGRVRATLFPQARASISGVTCARRWRWTRRSQTDLAEVTPDRLAGFGLTVMLLFNQSNERSILLFSMSELNPNRPITRWQTLSQEAWRFFSKTHPEKNSAPKS